VPRPETEHLVELALERIAGRALRVLDLCTGTGCIAVSIATHAPGCTVVATDLNPEAIALARENAAEHGGEVTFYEGDLFNALPADNPRFDIIVTNPPYVESGDWDTLPPDIRRYEDPAALLAGHDGLDLIRRIVPESLAWLNPGGHLAIEIGERQYDAAAQIFDAAGFQAIAHTKDLAGIRRIIHGAAPR
jgi:release factor glutamine methyltransferase